MASIRLAIILFWIINYRFRIHDGSAVKIRLLTTQPSLGLDLAELGKIKKVESRIQYFLGVIKKS